MAGPGNGGDHNLDQSYGSCERRKVARSCYSYFCDSCWAADTLRGVGVEHLPVASQTTDMGSCRAQGERRRKRAAAAASPICMYTVSGSMGEAKLDVHVVPSCAETNAARSPIRRQRQPTAVGSRPDQRGTVQLFSSPPPSSAPTSADSSPDVPLCCGA